MDEARALSLVYEFVRLGVFDITFAGGEPTLHPAILEMIKRCSEGGIRIGLLSNGVSLSPRFIEQLVQFTTTKNFIIQISIDSVQPEINDYSRGKTARVLMNLDKLRGSGLDVQIATVVHKRNLSAAHQIIEKYYPDIKRFHFLNIQRTASALEHPELLLSEDEALQFWLGLHEYAKKFPEDLFLPSLRIQLRALGNAKVDPEASLHRTATFDCGACSAGWTHVNVTANFDLLGCDIAKEHSFMGNVRDTPFEKVWRSSQADAIRRSPFPACYKIPAPDGSMLADHLRPEFRTLYS